jgi:23S rRNA pseudouridine2605 synthase
MQDFAGEPRSSSFVFNILQTHLGEGGFVLGREDSRFAEPGKLILLASERSLMPAERLQKIIATAGIASRRKAEQLIAGGLVSVNGQTVTELGTKADPEHDHIKVNGKLLKGPERHIYLLLNKPKGYVTTVTDPEGRPTVLDLVRGIGARVYPVGRLDYLSEGLLLLTNDGELAQKLMHASSHVAKTYLVKVSGKPADAQIEKLRGGVMLPAERSRLKVPVGRLPDERQRRRSAAVKTAPVRIKLLREAANPWYEVTLVEGRNRQIRRMFEEIGHHVEKIERVRYGPLQLDVEPGKFRHLTAKEVGQLKSASGLRERSSQH